MQATTYKRYLLGMLLVILAFNKLDSVALGVLLQSIKVDLKLTDAQLGMLSGIAFALFYSLMGIPIARWADRGDRVTIMAMAIAFWSVAVALCGAAGNFLQFALVRVGVAVGESGCIPPSHSLIADYFSRAERPRAVATYMFGYPVSYGIGYFLAGRLNELYGWRVTFILLGLPGIALAALTWLTLKEPRRDSAASQPVVKYQNARFRPAPPEGAAQCSAPTTLNAVCRVLWKNVTFRHLLLGYAVMSFFSYGAWQWKPAFFIRSYGLETRIVGAWLGAIYAVSGLLGMYCGGELACRYAKDNESLQLKIMAIAYVAFGIVSAGIYLSSDYHFAFAMMGLATLGMYATNGPLFATIQTLVPSGMRSTAVAIVYLFANLIGMGLGPVAAGALSDAFRPWAGEESLRYALLALCPGFLWSAWHLWQARKFVARDLELAQRAEPECSTEPVKSLRRAGTHQ